MSRVEVNMEEWSHWGGREGGMEGGKEEDGKLFKRNSSDALPPSLAPSLLT